MNNYNADLAPRAVDYQTWVTLLLGRMRVCKQPTAPRSVQAPHDSMLLSLNALQHISCLKKAFDPRQPNSKVPHDNFSHPFSPGVEEHYSRSMSSSELLTRGNQTLPVLRLRGVVGAKEDGRLSVLLPCSRPGFCNVRAHFENYMTIGLRGKCTKSYKHIGNNHAPNLFQKRR